MADVQLEKGHIRIANALNRAVIVARFSDVQRRIVSLLIDQTYGWQRRTVEISVPEIAALLDLTASGGFRAAMTDLVQSGVVQVLRAGTGRTRSVFAVQKDHEQWGRFAIASALLAARFGTRPKHADAMLAIGASEESTDGGGDGHVDDDCGNSREWDEGASSEAPSRASGGASPQAPSGDSCEGASVRAPSSEGASMQASSIEHASTEAPRVPAQSQHTCLHAGTLDPSKSSSDETYERGKTGKTVELQQPQRPRAHARDDEGVGVILPFDPAKIYGWEQLSVSLITDHNRRHVATFLASCADDSERTRFACRFENWLHKLDCPPEQAPTAEELATGLSEYAGDRSPRHVWAFVADAVQRYRRRAAGSGIAYIPPPRSRTTNPTVQAEASRLWGLIKREGLASCHPGLIENKVRVLAGQGEISDAEAFLTQFRLFSRDTLASARQDHFAIQHIADAIQFGPDPF